VPRGPPLGELRERPKVGSVDLLNDGPKRLVRGGARRPQQRRHLFERELARGGL
jgi:hypothetical protein